MDDLIRASQLSLEEIGQIGELKRQQRQARRQNSLSPKTFNDYDAERGSAELKSADGGQALTIRQGTLSNAAIQNGSRVASYGWKVPDYKPAQIETDGDTTAVGPPENQAGQVEPVADPDTPEGTPPLEELSAYCSCQTFWIRGTPADPDDWPDDLLECPFIGGQCSGTTYTVCVARDEIFNFNGAVNPTETCHEVTGPVSGTRYDNPSNFNPNRWALYLEHNGGETLLSSADNTAINGSRLEDIEITSVTGQPDDCGNIAPGCDLPGLPDTPRADADPGAWQKVTSCNLPLQYVFEDEGENTLITVWDAGSSYSNPLRRYGYPKGKFEYKKLCTEEGAPE